MGLKAYGGNVQKVNIANDGTFWFGASSGANSIVYDGSTLTVRMTLNADDINAGTLNASVVNVTNLNASNLAFGTISVDRFAANSITADKLNVSSLSAISANLGTVTAGSIDAASVTVNNLNATNITSGSLKNNMVRRYVTQIFGYINSYAANLVSVGLGGAYPNYTYYNFANFVSGTGRLVNNTEFTLSLDIGGHVESSSGAIRIRVLDNQHSTSYYSSLLNVDTDPLTHAVKTVTVPVSNDLNINIQAQQDSATNLIYSVINYTVVDLSLDYLT